eukprot:4619528-Lingulodinium_polyedra.AAC.1
MVSGTHHAVTPPAKHDTGPHDLPRLPRDLGTPGRGGPAGGAGGMRYASMCKRCILTNRKGGVAPRGQRIHPGSGGDAAPHG